MPRTSSDENENDIESGGRLPSAGDEGKTDDQPTGEASTAVKRQRAPNTSLDDDEIGDGIDVNPS